MNRLVYIGGLNNGKESALRVAGVVAETEVYDDIDTFSFSYASEYPTTVEQAIRGADVLTHSAGMIPVYGTSPNRIDSFNAPLPTSKRDLLARTVLKTTRMHIPGIGIKTREDLSAVMAYDRSAAAEVLRHPVANLKQLDDIAHFDAIEAAMAAASVDIPMTLHYTKEDEYYHPTEEDQIKAQEGGVNFMWLPGSHDELVLRPKTALKRYIKELAVSHAS